MRFQDIVDGKIHVGKTTSLTFRGQVYRGVTAIMELANAQLGIKEVVKNAEKPYKPRVGRRTSVPTKPRITSSDES